MKAPPMYKTLAGMEGVSNDPFMMDVFESVLKQLDEKYVESEQSIAGMTISTHHTLMYKGVSVQFLAIMEGMNQIIPAGQKGFSYSQNSTLYKTLRTKGRSHQQAISDIKSSLRKGAKPKSNKTSR